MSDTFVSYDDAAARLGIHRSTLGDWIAQGKLERVIIDGRGFITATSISRIAEARGTRMGQRQRDARSTGPAGIVPSSADSSPDAHAIAGVLTNAANAVRPAEFPADPGEAQRPGMYSWWGDDEACALLGSQLGIELPHLLYVGQAGATKRRSGVRSKATLASRVGSQHLRGNARSSTFRLTISSLLIDPLGLIPIGDRKLAAASNRRVSAWIADHMRVAIAPYDDRDSLGDVEHEVIVRLDPPLNLDHCPPTESRARLSRLRARLSQ